MEPLELEMRQTLLSLGKHYGWFDWEQMFAFFDAVQIDGLSMVECLDKLGSRDGVEDRLRMLPFPSKVIRGDGCNDESDFNKENQRPSQAVVRKTGKKESESRSGGKAEAAKKSDRAKQCANQFRSDEESQDDEIKPCPVRNNHRHQNANEKKPDLGSAAAKKGWVDIQVSSVVRRVRRIQISSDEEDAQSPTTYHQTRITIPPSKQPNTQTQEQRDVGENAEKSQISKVPQLSKKLKRNTQQREDDFVPAAIEISDGESESDLGIRAATEKRVLRSTTRGIRRIQVISSDSSVNGDDDGDDDDDDESDNSDELNEFSESCGSSDEEYAKDDLDRYDSDFIDDGSEDSYSDSEFEPGQVNEQLVREHDKDTEHLRPLPLTTKKSTLARAKSTPFAVKPEQHTGNGFRRNRVKLAQDLFAYYDKSIFGSELSAAGVSVEWSKRLNKTAGVTRCSTKKSPPVSAATRVAVIELSTKVVDRYDRLRNTLAHEMCHAAEHIIDRERPGHGRVFKKWTSKAHRFDDQLVITTKHSYEIEYKFQYQCIGKPGATSGCGQIYGRHSDSISLETQRCGKCGGKLQKAW